MAFQRSRQVLLFVQIWVINVSGLDPDLEPVGFNLGVIAAVAEILGAYWRPPRKERVLVLTHMLALGIEIVPLCRIHNRQIFEEHEGA